MIKYNMHQTLEQLQIIKITEVVLIKEPTHKVCYTLRIHKQIYKDNNNNFNYITNSNFNNKYSI